MTLIEIQNEVIARYNIIIVKNSTCWRRMHAHINERKICKWEQKASLKCTFELFHEIGHIETTKNGMRRAEEEYYATCWAIDRFKEYNLTLEPKTMMLFQWYILHELDRGLRRGGKGYPEMNLYKYAGEDKSISQFLNELPPRYRRTITMIK